MWTSLSVSQRGRRSDPHPAERIGGGVKFFKELKLFCWLGFHIFEVDSMSMEAYAQEFYYCIHCKRMYFKERK